MRLGAEIIRVCLAGTVMHFVIVAACSDGAIVTPDKPSHGPGPGDDGDGEGQGGDGGDVIAAAGAGGSTGGTPSDEPDEPPSMMVPVAQAKAAENGTRLKARYYVAADGARQFALGWYDSERNENCAFQRASDGVMRCLPESTSAVTSYFLDSACTEAVAGLLTYNCGFEYVLEPTANDCVYGLRIRSLAETLQPGVLHIKSGDSCVETPSPDGYTFRRLGPQVPPTSFVAATEQTDP